MTFFRFNRPRRLVSIHQAKPGKWNAYQATIPLSQSSHEDRQLSSGKPTLWVIQQEVPDSKPWEHSQSRLCSLTGFPESPPWLGNWCAGIASNPLRFLPI